MYVKDNTMFYQAIGNSIQANKDKIEKLEKQNERLKKKNKSLQSQLKAKEETINKAIEFTNKNWGTWCTHHLEYMTELQNILKEVSE